MALENTVQGCVFETWAALLATWQHRRPARLRQRARCRFASDTSGLQRAHARRRNHRLEPTSNASAMANGDCRSWTLTVHAAQPAWVGVTEGGAPVLVGVGGELFVALAGATAFGDVAATATAEGESMLGKLRCTSSATLIGKLALSISAFSSAPRPIQNSSAASSAASGCEAMAGGIWRDLFSGRRARSKSSQGVRPGVQSDHHRGGDHKGQG
jgi:hypothetical protein